MTRLACLTLLVASASAWAHKGSDAYWTLKASGAELNGRIDVALRDLALVVPLDVNGDGALTWGEVKAGREATCAVLQRALTLTQAGAACPLACGALELVRHSDGTYAAMALRATCPSPVRTLDVGYSLLFAADAEHRGLLSLSSGDAAHWDAFTNNQRQRQVTFAAVSTPAQLLQAFLQGVHHIGIGWDHLCFLFALLLPSVLRRDGGQWLARDGFKATLGDVARVVTAFTVAHSVTLGLAAFGLVHPNAQVVELAIALSVAVAALNNLVPFVPETRWSLAFALGLMHGFGFVSAVQDLGASGPLLWVSVLGFNLGVEAGQLLIVSAFVPLAWWLRRRPLYVRLVFPLGSAAILGIALFWTSERL